MAKKLKRRLSSKSKKTKDKFKRKSLGDESKSKAKHRAGKTKTKTKKSRRKKYQRGDLGRAIFSLFDEVGVDKATFKQALKIAKAAKPDTTYGEAYFSWHKNHYKNERNL